MLDYSPDIHYFYETGKSAFLYINPAIKEHFGISPDELINKKYSALSDIIHPEDRENFEKHWTSASSENNYHYKNFFN
ncbi:MAG: PAS domain-containing protein [Bacteroidales bacterium]|nr:PAS domain-containing protein [Bacteroidales bacterium]